MLNTYKARIDGDHIDWIGKMPAGLLRGRTVNVEISLLDEMTIKTARKRQGKYLADILEKLAALNAVASIVDPVVWQREQRIERTLPGR